MPVFAEGEEEKQVDVPLQEAEEACEEKEADEQPKKKRKGGCKKRSEKIKRLQAAANELGEADDSHEAQAIRTELAMERWLRARGTGSGQRQRRLAEYREFDAAWQEAEAKASQAALQPKAMPAPKPQPKPTLFELATTVSKASYLLGSKSKAKQVMAQAAIPPWRQPPSAPGFSVS